MTLERVPVDAIIPAPLEGVVAPVYDDIPAVTEFQDWLAARHSGALVDATSDILTVTVPDNTLSLVVDNGVVVVYAPGGPFPFVVVEGSQGRFAVTPEADAAKWGWTRQTGPWVAPS